MTLLRPQLAAVFLAMTMALVLLWHPSALPLLLLAALALAANLLQRVQAALHVVMALLVASLPLSWELPLLQGHMLRVPAEALVALLLFMALFRYSLMDAEALLRRQPWPALWVLSFIVPTVLSSMPLVSLKYALLNAAYVAAFFYLVYRLLEEGLPYGRWIHIFSIGFLLAWMWAAWQYAGYSFNPVTLPGIFKPFLNDHTIAGAIAAMLSAWYVVYGAFTAKKAYLAAGLLLATLVLASSSRAAILSMAVVPVALLYAYASFWRKAIPVMLVCAVAVLVVQRESVVAYLTSTKREAAQVGGNVIDRVKSSSNAGTDVSNIERLNRWYAALALFAERPHTGHGPGTYQFVYIPYQSPAFENRLTVHNPERPPEGSGGTAHSELMLQLSENGWPSTLVFLLLLGRWVWLFLLWGRRERPLLCAAAAALGTYVVHMQFNNFLGTAAMAWLFGGMAACLEYQALRMRNEYNTA